MNQAVDSGQQKMTMRPRISVMITLKSRQPLAGRERVWSQMAPWKTAAMTRPHPMMSVVMAREILGSRNRNQPAMPYRMAVTRFHQREDGTVKTWTSRTTARIISMMPITQMKLAPTIQGEARAMKPRNSSMTPRIPIHHELPDTAELLT